MLIIGFGAVQSAEAQCLPRTGFYFGELLPNNGCGTFASSGVYGPGEFFRMPLLLGGSYTISTCGSTIDTQITGFEGNITTASIFYNDDNGPDCSGTQASVTYVSTFSDYTRVNVQQYNCAAGGTASIIVKVRQNNNLMVTSSAADMCEGDSRSLTATPATAPSGQPGGGDLGTFSGLGVSGTTFTAPIPTGAMETFTITYTFGYCTTTQDIDVYAPPSAADAGPDQTAICGTSTILQGAAPAMGSGAWTTVSGPGTAATPGATNSSVTGLTVTPTVMEWTVTNGSCTASTSQVTLTLESVAPVPSAGTLPDVMAECSATPPAPVANDACAGVITGTPSIPLPVTAPGLTVLTWTYDDGNGNTATQTQNVTLADITAPVPDSLLLPDVTAECSVDSASVVIPTATDNCDGLLNGTPDVTFPITAQGTTTITWTYTDGTTNFNTQTQDVVIADTTAPVADSLTLPDVIGVCSVDSASVAIPTGTDNCIGAVNGTPDVTFPIAAGTTMITWTFSDGTNLVTQTQNVIISDTLAPVADAATLSDVNECVSASPTAPTATDDCAGTIIGTPSVSFPITAPGLTVVTWTYDDGANTTTQTQNVTVTVVETGVTAAGALLTSDAVGATYQWLDCDNGMAIIPGETNQSFTATMIVGNYAVEVTENGCTDTSACLLVDFTGVNTIANVIEVSIYPNPTDGKFSVEFTGVSEDNLEMRIIDMTGRVVVSEMFAGISGSHIEKVDISQNQSGAYIINLIGENGVILSKRIVKD